ncbi:MAG: GNAT family N-acetyltransferase [Prevotella sp.]|nr:GNAT family N-acetyltransferase [Prevotella sp.]
MKPGYLASINNLLLQLSDSIHTITEEELNTLLSSSQSHLYVLESDGQFIGMTTLCLYQCPTGWKAWIEDVIVDRNFRGKGYGKLMVRKAMEECKNRGNVTLMLTSRPSRIVANQLYQSLGFEKRETNVYKMKF